MPTKEYSITINRPPPVVFDYLAELSNFPKWQSNAASAEWTSDPLRAVGSTFAVVANVMGQTAKITMQFTSWDPPAHASFRSIDGPVPIETSLTLAAQDGGTFLTCRSQVTLSGFLSLMGGMVADQMATDMQAGLSALKAQLEAS